MISLTPQAAHGEVPLPKCLWSWHRPLPDIGDQNFTRNACGDDSTEATEATSDGGSTAEKAPIKRVRTSLGSRWTARLLVSPHVGWNLIEFMKQRTSRNPNLLLALSMFELSLGSRIQEALPLSTAPIGFKCPKRCCNRSVSSSQALEVIQCIEVYIDS